MIKKSLLYRTRSAHIVAAIPSYYQSSYKDNFRQIQAAAAQPKRANFCAISDQIARMLPRDADVAVAHTSPAQARPHQALRSHQPRTSAVLSGQAPLITPNSRRNIAFAGYVHCSGVISAADHRLRRGGR
jgi:hypothetical protein